MFLILKRALLLDFSLACMTETSTSEPQLDPVDNASSVNTDAYASQYSDISDAEDEIPLNVLKDSFSVQVKKIDVVLVQGDSHELTSEYFAGISCFEVFGLISREKK